MLYVIEAVLNMIGVNNIQQKKDLKSFFICKYGCVKIFV